MQGSAGLEAAAGCWVRVERGVALLKGSLGRSPGEGKFGARTKLHGSEEGKRGAGEDACPWGNGWHKLSQGGARMPPSTITEDRAVHVTILQPFGVVHLLCNASASMLASSLTGSS